MERQFCAHASDTHALSFETSDRKCKTTNPFPNDFRASMTENAHGAFERMRLVEVKSPEQVFELGFLFFNFQHPPKFSNSRRSTAALLPKAFILEFLRESVRPAAKELKALTKNHSSRMMDQHYFCRLWKNYACRAKDAGETAH